MVRTRATSSATNYDDPSRVEAPTAPRPSTTSAHNPFLTNPLPSSVVHRPPPVERPAYEDVRLPYYLSTAEHPGMVLVTSVLTDKNFQPWKRD
uniref:Uncharacterized protein n=1 Tax=Cannabis sativa TaxID=3483 RepID=A0A803QGV1_CANSA